MSRYKTRDAEPDEEHTEGLPEESAEKRPVESPVPLTGDFGKDLMALFANELQRRLIENAKDMTSSELEVVRKLLGDNSVTLASIKRGDFGSIAKKAAEDFPFPDDFNAQAPLGKPVN